MERTEKIGLGVAGAGHLILFGLLSVGFLATPNPETLKPQPISVTLSEDVAMEATAPQSEVAPAQSVAPEIAPPEDAAPPAPSEVVEPEPAPAPPKPAPPPEPAPRPEPKPQPKPAPAPKPDPKPQPKPKPAPAAKPEAKPQPKPKPTQAAAPAREQPSRNNRPQSASRQTQKPSAAPAQGSTQQTPRRKPGGLTLGADVFKGANDRPAPKSNVTAQAATISREALSGIIEAIRRQIQPCADRQVNPGPGANQIVVTLNLKLNRDGSLAGSPSLVGTTGVNDANERYRQRVIDLGIAAFRGCAPLQLPAQYYQTANGGWGNINYKWQLR